MPKPTKKRRVSSKPKTAKPATARSKASNSRATKTDASSVRRPSPRVEQPSPDEEAVFTKTLIDSGQAARLDKEGKLPAGATHKIVEDEAGNVKVVRRRFSIT